MYLRNQVFASTVLLVSVVGGCLVYQSKQVNQRVVSEHKIVPETASKMQSKVVNQPLPELVAGVQYRPDIVPEKMTIQEKKQRFKALLVPVVDKVYADLEWQYQQIKQALNSGLQQDRIAKLKQQYKVTTDQQLLIALKPHPKSIALAQGAIESAWGTSRFFTQANNVFGIWSFNNNEPRIAARKSRGEKTIWLKQYSSLYESVKDNYELLAKSDAFKEFRLLRFQTDDPYALVKKLDRYSEQGSKYGNSLASMISYNQFFQYDK